tara:strand:- start:551 stop:1129 length:579 start_codon:yes stop_codon:yes gene_type:complete
MEYSSRQKAWEVISGWMNHNMSLYWINKLQREISWQRPVVKIFGKKHIVPRKTSFLAEKGISYRYSGYTHYGIGWPIWFLPLLELVQQETSIEFNGCLLNLYRSGNDHMGWHSDAEKELDKSKAIASLSLGSERDLLLKNKKLGLKEKLSLSNGDLLIMHPACQDNWLHSLPKRRNITGLRINLTFRKYLRD